MSKEDVKQLAYRFFEALNAGDLETLGDVLSRDFVDHGAGGGESIGTEPFFEFLGMVTGTFPDINVTIEDVIAEANQVAVRVTVRGTHEGVFLEDIQPTGKLAEWTGIDIFEVRQGRIVERWSERDLLGLVAKLENG